MVLLLMGLNDPKYQAKFFRRPKILPKGKPAA